MTAPARLGAAGAVLAGGRSRRMGRDKALVPVADGRPLALVAADALLAAGAGPVVAIGGPLALRDHGLAVVDDLHPGEGPLGGLLTALAALERPVVAVLTCDLPAITAAEVTALVAALARAPGAHAAVAVLDGRRQYLTAAYRRAAAGPLATAFAAGERSASRAAATLHVVEVHGLDAGHLTDADTPEELAAHLPAPSSSMRPRSVVNTDPTGRQ
jgi:molybdopterin-guanine dinucleotide biosynthesis protein A